MISQSEDNQIESIDSQRNDFSKKDRKRRSKHDQQGRNAKCKHCDKTYLSSIALNNHIKTKHSHLTDSVTRGRGRPRKIGMEDFVGENESFDMKYRNFFESIDRKKGEEEEYDFEKTMTENFDNLFLKYKGVIFKGISSPDEFQLNNISSSIDSCDYAFRKYLSYVSERVKKDYFDFVYKYIVLFRESINIKKEKEGLIEYTSKNSAEIVPDCCNDFVGDFLEVNDNFNLDLNELIEIIQHSCQWLWENGYTTSKLSLISS